MINTSEVYKAVVVADARRTRVKVPLRVTSPDLTYGTITAAEAASSHPEQLRDSELISGEKFADLEASYWALDGSFGVWTDDFSTDSQVGLIGGAISDGDGETDVTITMTFSGVTIMQAVTVAFSRHPDDGIATDFTVTVCARGTPLVSKAYTGNASAVVEVTGFTVYNPDTIALHITKWSLPYRRVRVMELFPGVARDWTEKDVVSVSIQMQASLSTVAQPYGLATITIDNTNRTFDPRDKDSLFLSLEDRQNIPIYFGFDTENGATEYVPTGVWYIHADGWSSTNEWAGMRWRLVDIIGLLSDRVFVVPATLPTTLSGWIAALVAQLGTNFAGRYTVDENYAGISMTATAEDVENMTCAELLRLLCQASGTFARMDAETGYLAVEPLWNQGNQYTLNNLSRMPTLQANVKLGSIVFRVGDEDLEIGFSDDATANNLSIRNPFITTEEKALEAAKNIMVHYGGNKISATGRGDPSSEVGDVATVELLESDATVGRITAQSFDYTGGVLQNCKIEMLQADGVFHFENREEITESGTWTVPTGVTQISVVIVGGGQGGGHGQRGTAGNEAEQKEGWVNGQTGQRGADGSGGRVWAGTLSVSSGQSFAVTIGVGGAASTSGESAVDGQPTTFGAYSSANGRVYSPAYTDIASGNAYGRTGIKSPISNRGDGGAGGEGGTPGAIRWKKVYDIHGNWTGRYTQIDSRTPGNGAAGYAGASGCVIVYWSKEAET